MPSMYDVANKIPIKTVIEDYTGIKTNIRGNVSCPFHEDAKPSFRIYEKTNSYHCFSCKSNGTPINFIMDLTGMTAEGAAKELCDTYNLQYTNPKPMNPDYKNYTDVYEYVAGFFNALNKHKKAVKYDFWHKRGISSALVDEYKLGYSLDTYISSKTNQVISFKDIIRSKFPSIDELTLDSYGLYDKYGQAVMTERFIIPIMDHKGNVVGFSGRDATDNPNIPKYINTPETEYFKKKQLLFNYHQAKKYPTIYVVEGYMDALSLISAGIKNVVASMGTSFTEEHMKLLADKEIILAFDNDSAGRDSIMKLIERYPNKHFKVYVGTTKYKDFNEAWMDGDDLSRVTKPKNNIYAVEFMIRYLKEKLDLSVLYNRELLYNKVNAASKTYSPVARDYFATILQRLLKGKRA